MTQLLRQSPQRTAVSPPRRRRVPGWKWLLILPPIFVIWMEIFLRVAPGFGHPLLYKTDAACGYVVQPNQNIVRLRCANVINHAGMRSPEFADQRPAGTLRVLLIGDSVTYGTTYVPQEQIFSALLAKGLPVVVHKPAEVLNAGVGGWAPGNEEKFLISRGTYDASIVLMVWNTDDLGQAFVDFPGGLQFPATDPWTAIGEVWSRYAEPRLFHRAAPVDPGSVAGDSPANESEVARQNLDLLTEAQAFTKKAGAEFGVVLVPSGRAFQTAAHIVMRDNLSQWSVDHHAPFFNLTDELSHDDPAAVYFDGIHLRPHGDELVAKGLLAQWPEKFPAPDALAPAAAAR